MAIAPGDINEKPKELVTTKQFFSLTRIEEKNHIGLVV